MPQYSAPLTDIAFQLFHVFKSEVFWQKSLGMEDLDEEMATAILSEAAKLFEQQISPLNRSGDEQGCKLTDTGVVSPEGFAQAYRMYCESGWAALGGDEAYGGSGMPKSLVCAVEEMLQGACMSFGLAPMLTVGATLAILNHASEELKVQFLPKLYSGEWSAAMDLTEPHAGTDLGLINTRAEPQADGSVEVFGSKIFITWGEHDMSDNIIHLVLAKLPRAPAGSKGISMILVPRYIQDSHGEYTVANQVSCGALEKKMGIHGSATCVMNFDGAKGWLVGEENKGLACMFTMMNYERLVVGIQGLGAASLSYQQALAYAKERLQSRSVTAVKCPQLEADPIIYHSDVKRMLWTMKAFDEAGRAFYVYLAQWLDRAKYTENAAQRSLAQNRVALLTPVAKAFMSDRAFEAAVLGQQVLGGHGYIREWGQEQVVRDTRITQIYEGTNGIQAMDLIGRKTLSCQGAFLAEYLTEIYAYMEQHDALLESLGLHQKLHVMLQEVQELTRDVVGRSIENPNYAGSVAVEYLDLIGLLSYGYMWILQACSVAQGKETGTLTSELYQSKVTAASFYFKKIFPDYLALIEKIRSCSDDWTDDNQLPD